MPGTFEHWRGLVKSARWWRMPHRANLPSIRCGVCRRTFSPGADGAAVFVEERGALLIRVCPACEKTLTITKSLAG
jgi:hypothetical protein